MEGAECTGEVFGEEGVEVGHFVFYIGVVRVEELLAPRNPQNICQGIRHADVQVKVGLGYFEVIIKYYRLNRVHCLSLLISNPDGRYGFRFYKASMFGHPC